MDTTNMILTKHSIQRAKERLGVRNEEKLMRRACNAWERGLTADQSENIWQRQYMINKESDNTVVRIHSNTVFIFGVDNGVQTLITLYPLPKNAAGSAFRSGRNSNPKRNMQIPSELLN